MSTYYLGEGNTQSGPFTFEQLSEQNVRPGTLVWREGFVDWTRADAIEELKPLFEARQNVAVHDAPQDYQEPPPPESEPAVTAPQWNPPVSHTAPQPAQGHPYGQILGYGPPPGRFEGPHATTSLVLGIIACVSFLCFPIGLILGPFAIVLGAKARAHPRQHGVALAGIITGSIASGLSFLIAVLTLIGMFS
jgi:hypothetical protein